MDEQAVSDARAARLGRIEGEQFFHTALCGPMPAIDYDMMQALARAFPDKALIETTANGMFDVEAYAEAGQCAITRVPVPATTPDLLAGTRHPRPARPRRRRFRAAG